ncbi:MAG: glycosyltransferase [Pseudomonadota bacterium]
MPLLNRLKTSPLARALRGARSIRGNVDGFQDGELFGWAIGPNGTHVSVGIFAGGGMVAQASANIFRGDLRAAGIGTGDHAFCIPLSDTMRQTIARQGGSVDVRALGTPARSIGTFTVPDPQGLTPEPANTPTPAPIDDKDLLGQLVFGDLQTLRAATKTPPPDKGAQPSFRPHAKMFAQTTYLGDAPLPAPTCAYTEYVRYRYKLDAPFPTQDDPGEVAHFLQWYLAAYGPLRKGLRTPMSAEMIAWYNTPVTIPGKRVAFTRSHWSFLMGVPPILHSTDFDNRDWVAWAVYWWAIDQAKALHCEDCLVPDDYVTRLATIAPSEADIPWPLTQFMSRLHAQTAGLNTLDTTTENGRRNVTCAIMVMAIERPDYLRYLPPPSIDAALEGGHLIRFAADHGVADLDLTRDLYARLMATRGFDLDTRTFRTTLENGNRMEAVLRPTPAGDPVDIQMIGPFEKASGLGQATRLSHSVLTAAGHDPNCVNFGLDNPAPEGFSTKSTVSDWRPAKMNLIHLNAESIPLVYAYGPDVFSDAYNIGYFYWELNTPAACHFLGMDLLDEIWVSTDYGVAIYGPANQGRPVINVGMCYEDLPNLKRDTSRAFVEDRFDLTGDEFVFLVAFDSFSFVQRKNPIGTLKAFQKAFDKDAPVRLVIKTQNRTRITDPAQQVIWDEVDKIMAGDDRIRILDETLAYDDLLRLKQGSDCYISLHKSEGWGFGMIEAMNLGIPVVATAYSGNMDFCRKDTVWLVEYEEVELKEDDYIFVRPGQKWANPDIDDAARQLYAVYSDTAEREARAKAARDMVRQDFSAEAIGKRYATRLDTLLKDL